MSADPKTGNLVPHGRGLGLVVRHNGDLYLTSTFYKKTENKNGPTIIDDINRLWQIDSKGEKTRELDIANDIQAITLSPDQSLLYVADAKTHWVYGFQIQPDGSLTHKQRFYHLHLPDSDEPCTHDMRMDRDGRLYVATSLGIQICDPSGRVSCIVPTPNGPATSICFGGANFDHLFAICGDKVYARKLKVQGANAFEAPIKPGQPRQ